MDYWWQKVNLEPNDRVCLIKYGIDKYTFSLILNNLIIPEHDGNIQRFLACVWQRHGDVTPNGAINLEPIRTNLVPVMKNLRPSWFAEPLVDGILKICREVHGNTLGQQIVLTLNCITRQIEEEDVKISDRYVVSTSGIYCADLKLLLLPWSVENVFTLYWYVAEIDTLLRKTQKVTDRRSPTKLNVLEKI